MATNNLTKLNIMRSFTKKADSSVNEAMIFYLKFLKNMKKNTVKHALNILAHKRFFLLKPGIRLTQLILGIRCGKIQGFANMKKSAN